MQNEEASTILKVYEEFCATHQEPLLISCDNGGEFNLIETPKINNPYYHLQANSGIERFHLELGKQCRIHNLLPPEAVHKITADESKLLMSVHLKNEFYESEMCVLQYNTRKFRYNELVWRHINRRARAKHEDTYSGPHRILAAAGEFSYFITSHLKTSRKLQVNLNDIKKFHVPDTRGWTLNLTDLDAAINTLGVLVRNKTVLIDFNSIEALIEDVLEDKLPHIQFVVIPEWPCMAWYKRLHNEIRAEAVKLTSKPEFLNDKGKALGMFAWENWLFALNG